MNHYLYESHYKLVYAGKTLKCLPMVDFLEDWDITFMKNYCYNEAVMSNLVWIHSTLHWLFLIALGDSVLISSNLL